MGINAILDLTPTDVDTYSIRDSNQVIIHFKSILEVDEAKFGSAEDPIVIFRTKDTQEQVRVFPFNFENIEKETLPFVEKKQYYSNIVTSFRDNKAISNHIRDMESTSVFSLSYGTAEEFDFHLKNPTDIGISPENFFGSVFADLKIESLSEITIGLGETING